MVENEENKTNKKIETNNEGEIWTTLDIRKSIVRTQNYMQAAKKSGAKDEHVQQLHSILLEALKALDEGDKHKARNKLIDAKLELTDTVNSIGWLRKWYLYIPRVYSLPSILYGIFLMLAFICLLSLNSIGVIDMPLITNNTIINTSDIDITTSIVNTSTRVHTSTIDNITTIVNTTTIDNTIGNIADHTSQSKVPVWSLLIAGMGSTTQILIGIASDFRNVGIVRKYKRAWYMILPFIGLAFGFVMYLTVNSGLMAINPSSSDSGRYLLMLLCFMAGYATDWFRIKLVNLLGE